MRLQALATLGMMRGAAAARRAFQGMRWLAVLLVILSAGTAMAQLAGKGAISGSIKDKSGALIPGAQVMATNDATGISYMTESSSAGTYQFANLEPGIYTLDISAKGFESLDQKNIHVDAMATVDYNPELPVGGAKAETVTVTDEPPMLETSNATLGATMENETYAELPIEMGAYGQPDQRRATDFAFLMPGVQGNNTTGNATTNTGVVNGSGSKGSVSAVYIDGIPFVRAGGTGDPRYVWTAISVDAVDQFQVQTVGYPAIYEGQGVMNYTIKTGGLKPHVSMYEFFRNTALDSWGFWKATDPVTKLPIKSVEHMDEYGINISGPLVPFGAWKKKLFFFTNYSGYRYSATTPTAMTFPNTNELNGIFTDVPTPIFDPFSQATCTAANKNIPCRYPFLANGSDDTSQNSNTKNVTSANVLPSSMISPVATAMLLPLKSLMQNNSNQSISNNYVAPNATTLNNWTNTNRIDYTISQSDTLALFAAFGRQASSWPVGQTTAGRGVGPIPYSYGQAYAPKTVVAALEEVHVFSPYLVNQFKYGYARYYGPTFNTDQGSAYAASTMGVSGLPVGQAAGAFPIVNFNSAANTPTNFAGTTANLTLAENFTLLDNLSWTKGKHSFTMGGQTAWLLYNTISATGGSTPLTMKLSPNETAGISSTKAGSYAALSNSGNALASFMVGEIDNGSYSQYLQSEFGARFRAISGYVQDNWKVTPKLTVDAGVRYDFYPTVHEVHNAQSFFNPNLANPITGINGALEYTGYGANTCNCETPVNNYYKNIGPRLGVAYQLDSKTVIRASYGVMFTHGNAVGGNAYALGTLGFATQPSSSTNSGANSMTSVFDLSTKTGTYAFPSSIVTPALGAASGPAYGSGYLTSLGTCSNSTAGSSCYGASTGSPSSGANYVDPYLGSRAPEFLNWSFGVQRQLTSAFALTVTYVGSEGHFIPSDGSNARGYWADQLDPQLMVLGSTALASKTYTAATCATLLTNLSGVASCPANYAYGQGLSAALKPFPYHSVGDTFGYVGNTNYNAIQAVLTMRAWHGLTINSNYTFAKAIDDAGTYRTGYAIPAGMVDGQSSKSFAADAIERGVSTSNQPQHFVFTAVYALPFGKSVFGDNQWVRMIAGGFKVSSIYQAFSGSPLAMTGSTGTCASGANPIVSTCEPSLSSTFTGPARINGKWGKGMTYNSTTPVSYIDKTAFTAPSTLTLSGGTIQAIGNAPRTAPYNLYGPSFTQWDGAVVRTFPLHFMESAKLNFRAEMYNITNRSYFAVSSLVVDNAAFGQVGTNTGAPKNRSAQFSARIEF